MIISYLAIGNMQFPCTPFLTLFDIWRTIVYDLDLGLNDASIFLLSSGSFLTYDPFVYACSCPRSRFWKYSLWFWHSCWEYQTSQVHIFFLIVQFCFSFLLSFTFRDEWFISMDSSFWGHSSDGPFVLFDRFSATKGPIQILLCWHQLRSTWHKALLGKLGNDRC